MFLAVYKPAVCQWRSDFCTKVSVTLSFFFLWETMPFSPQGGTKSPPCQHLRRKKKKACYLLFAIIVLVTPATQYLRLVFLG